MPRVQVENRLEREDTALTQIEFNNLAAKDFLLSTQYHPVVNYYEDRHDAKAGIFKLPESFWPRLPLGYMWKKNVNTRTPMLPAIYRNINFPDVPIKIVIYSVNGGNSAKSMNYLTLFEGPDSRLVNMQSYANTKNDGTRSGDMQRSYPMDTKDYRAPNGMRFMRGHCIDHADMPGAQAWTMDHDSRNYIPENPRWGGHPRNYIVRHMLRTIGGAYMQMPYYHDVNPFDFINSNCLRTANRTLVPLGVLFSGVSADRKTNLFTIRASWSFDYTIQYQAVCAQLNLQDHNEIPTPLVIDPLNFNNQAIRYTHQSDEYRTPGAENPRAQVLAGAKAAQLEFKSIEQKLQAVLSFNRIGNKAHANAFLSDACITGQFLSQLDDKRMIFSTPVFNKIKQIFRENNKSKNDCIEILEKIHKDCRKG